MNFLLGSLFIVGMKKLNKNYFCILVGRHEKNMYRLEPDSCGLAHRLLTISPMIYGELDATSYIFFWP